MAAHAFRPPYLQLDLLCRQMSHEGNVLARAHDSRCDRTFSYSNARMTIDALWPPNPNEFDIATFKSGRSRATFGT